VHIPFVMRSAPYVDLSTAKSTMRCSCTSQNLNSICVFELSRIVVRHVRWMPTSRLASAGSSASLNICRGYFDVISDIGFRRQYDCHFCCHCADFGQDYSAFSSLRTDYAMPQCWHVVSDARNVICMLYKCRMVGAISSPKIFTR